MRLRVASVAKRSTLGLSLLWIVKSYMGHLIFETSLSQKNYNFEVSLVPKLSHNVGVFYYHIYTLVQVQARNFIKVL